MSIWFLVCQLRKMSVDQQEMTTKLRKDVHRVQKLFIGQWMMFAGQRMMSTESEKMSPSLEQCPSCFHMYNNVDFVSCFHNNVGADSVHRMEDEQTSVSPKQFEGSWKAKQCLWLFSFDLAPHWRSFRWSLSFWSLDILIFWLLFSRSFGSYWRLSEGSFMDFSRLIGYFWRLWRDLRVVCDSKRIAKL